MKPKSNDFGMSCPKCKKDDGIAIVIKAWAMLTPDGTDPDDEACPDYDHEWDDDSPAMCVNCGHTGKVLNFNQE